MRSLALLVLIGASTGCATLGEGTPRGMGAAVGRAGASCHLDRQAGRPGTIAPASGTPRVDEGGNGTTCAGRDGRAATTTSVPKSVGISSGGVVQAGPVAVGASAGGASFRSLSRVGGATAPVMPPAAGFVPSSVSDDDAPFITVVPNPFRTEAVASEQSHGRSHGAPRPMGRTTL